MSKKLLAFALLILVSHFAAAQEIEWQNGIGGSLYEDVKSIIQTADGGYLVGGITTSPVSGDITQGTYNSSDYCIFRTDSLGNILWQKSYGSNSQDVLTGVLQVSDGGFIIGGYSGSFAQGSKTENPIGEWDFWILKIDANGNIEWDNTIGGSKDDKLISMANTPDGGFLFVGYSESDISGDKTDNSRGAYDYWIVKMDSTGTIQWDKTIGGSKNDLLNRLTISGDGGYYLGGNSLSPISGDKTETSNNTNAYWIVKIDSIGQLLWQKTFLNCLDFRCFINTIDGGLLMGGDSGPGNSNYKIVKTDSSGTIQWQKLYTGMWDDNLAALVATDDGGYLVGGHSHSGIGYDKTENPNGYRNFWIIKTDDSGGIQWQNTIGGDNEFLQTIIPTFDGGYLLGGIAYGNGYTGDIIDSLHGSSDVWIVKITNNYNQIQGKTYADLNSNQQQEPGEPALAYLRITEVNSNRLAFSHANGFYSVTVVDTGNFVVIPDYVNLFTPVPSAHPVTFTSIHQSDSLNDFAFAPTSVSNDLCLTISPTSPFRSGFNASYTVNYSNQGTTTLLPTIVFYPDANVSFLSASITPTTVTPDSVIFVLSAITPFQTGQITITISVDLGLPIGTLINSGAMILPIANDANPGCNSAYWEVLTTGSFDPNDILVNRYFLYDYEMSTPPDLEYIINFQNTGNDTAFTVKILNQLDTTRLDLSTLNIVTTSHEADIRFVYHERNLEFVMNNILLPDSNVNEPMSHGFVRYRIKPKSTVAVGDFIQNSATIYFDFNNPVITNTAVTSIILPTGLSAIAYHTPPVIFPNPVANELTIQLKNSSHEPVTIELFNIFGQRVMELFADKIPSGTWNKKFDVSSLDQGVYFIRINNNPDSIGKIVKM